MKILGLIVCALLLLASCQTRVPKDKGSVASPLDQLDDSKFKTSIDGKSTQLFRLKNSGGMEAAITNYGGRIVGLVVPNKKGEPTDVVIGMESIQAYQNSTEPYFGALIGRVGNRIAEGKFTLDEKVYQLSLNNGPNTLHGGNKGFQYVVWDAEQINDSTLKLSYLSKDGEENFPGNLKVDVVYALTVSNGLDIQYSWSSDSRTVANLTNHAFFNLNGEGSGTILNHDLIIHADRFTPVNSTLIPTGEITDVLETPFEFRSPHTIGARIDTLTNEQLKFGKGYDHNFTLNRMDDKLEWVAQAKGDKSGIVMHIYTTEPGLQFYSGNFMQSKNKLKYGGLDDFRTAFCLETQHFPDAPNQSQFPSIVVEPDSVYTSHTVYQFEAI